MGVSVGRQGLDLDRLDAVVNGRALRHGRRPTHAGLAGLGYRADRGGVVLGGEIEVQPTGQAISRDARCSFGQTCVAVGLSGRVGPIYRLRATWGRQIRPGLLLSGGVGMSLADVSVSHAFAQAASADGASAVITTARSPFVVEDMARGLHVAIGLEHRLTARRALRVDLLHERLNIDNQRRVFILTTTASGPSSATAQIAETGRFALRATALRVSLVLRF